MLYRADSGDELRASMGLGRAICKGLVEAQGGSIPADAVNPEGTGLRITLRLPVETTA